MFLKLWGKSVSYQQPMSTPKRRAKDKVPLSNTFVCGYTQIDAYLCSVRPLFTRVRHELRAGTRRLKTPEGAGKIQAPSG